MVVVAVVGESKSVLVRLVLLVGVLLLPRGEDGELFDAQGMVVAAHQQVQST